MNAAGAGGGEDPNNHPHNNPHNPNVTKAAKKRAKARQKKIENNRRIQNEESRRSTFAEHRTRLYGDGNEIATLCDTGQVSVSGLMRQFGEQQSGVAALNARYNRLLERVHAAIQRNVELTRQSREVREAVAAQGLEPGWWERPVDELSIDQVDRNMEELNRFLHSLTAADNQEPGPAWRR